MLTKIEVFEMIEFYREEQSTLPLEAQKQIDAIVAALNHTVTVTGKQGTISAGIFMFEKLLELLNVGETQQAASATTGQGQSIDDAPWDGTSGSGSTPGSDVEH